MKKNAVVIGYGGMGGWHTERLLKSDVVNLLGIYDIKEERRELARSRGIFAYDSLEAVLGDEITVPTIDGKVKYTIPEGFQPETVVRLRGKGVQRINSRGRGDQYVKVVVEVPKNLNKQQKDALRNFDALLNDKQHAKKKGFFDTLKENLGG